MLTIRPATLSDVSALFVLICALAEYEQLSHVVTGSPEALREHLFGTRPYAEAIVAQWEQETVGFALFFPNYSTIKFVIILHVGNRILSFSPTNRSC
jgi:hypothetical protein